MLVFQLASQSKIDLFDCKCYFTSKFFVSMYRFIAVLSQNDYVIVRFVIRRICQLKWNFSNLIELLLVFDFLSFQFSFFSITFVISHWSHSFVVKLFSFCHSVNYCHNFWILQFAFLSQVSSWRILILIDFIWLLSLFVSFLIFVAFLNFIIVEFVKSTRTRYSWLLL